MKRGNNKKSFITWINEIFEEIEIQFYGIIGAVIFFVLLNLLFQPPWMKPLIEFLYNIKLFS